MIEWRHYIVHPPKRETLIKFVALMGVFIAYFIYVSIKFDVKTGGGIAALTWSFFVLCTPVADAGFLLDFPVRLITAVRMFVTEVVVWVLAIAINLSYLTFNPGLYESTFITRLLHQIIIHPWPYWSIIVLCGIGTFMSVAFGDELMDVASHKERVLHHKVGFAYRGLMVVALFVLVFMAYGFLLKSLGIEASALVHGS
ncbi:MAG: hypothetical protein EP347_02295 [Alphaproteobacteria bacterium]|nr:MAG: hypothetical protein EP347_02295 [Alphaproteobacteria bacterium]